MKPQTRLGLKRSKTTFSFAKNVLSTIGYGQGNSRTGRPRRPRVGAYRYIWGKVGPTGTGAYRYEEGPTGSPPQAGKFWGDLAGPTDTGRCLRVGSPPRAGFFVGPTGMERNLRVVRRRHDKS